MRDTDAMIDKAVGEEERELLRQIDDEPAFATQAIGLFRGRLGWINATTMISQIVLFLAGVWAAWHFFEATDPVTQLRWGLPASVLLLMSLILKMGMWPTIQANRMLRELKRLELQIARSR